MCFLLSAAAYNGNLFPGRGAYRAVLCESVFGLKEAYRPVGVRTERAVRLSGVVKLGREFFLKVPYVRAAAAVFKKRTRLT